MSEAELENPQPSPSVKEKADEEEDVDMTYHKELRQATKEVHKVSDILVNAKFALALNNDEVWYDGLLAFHELYKYFEQHLPAELLPKEFHRTEAFERDLTFFYGKDWKKTYDPRPSIKQYLKHLDEVSAKSKVLLFAYAFQMYMALMSGGQLLQKKRMIARKLWVGKVDKDDIQDSTDADGNYKQVEDLQSRPMPDQVKVCPPGCESTFFPEDIKVLKNKLRRILNEQFKNFDDQMREDFIEASRNVFILNSTVVRSIKGVNYVTYTRLAFVVGLVISIFLAYKYAKA